MLKNENVIFEFNTARGRNPCRELSKNEFTKFINQITKEESFTNLILDCGNGLDDSIVAAFQLSTHIFHITGKSGNYHRSSTYLRTIANRLAERDSSAIIQVTNFYIATESEEWESANEDKIEKLIIEEDNTSFNSLNGRTVISLDKMFGQGIRDIVQHITLSSN